MQASLPPSSAWPRSRPSNGRATAARLALVAGERLAAPKIGAAGSLQEIAADGRHVAQLLRGRLPQRFRKRRIVLHQPRIGGDVAHARQRAEHQLVLAGGVESAQLAKRMSRRRRLIGVSTFSFIRS